MAADGQARSPHASLSRETKYPILTGSTTLLLSLFVLCLVQPARAWNAEGHMVVAQIAYNHLNPDVKAKCDALISIPVFNSGNNNSNFVTAACWADDIKSFTSTYNIWHYIDIPFSPDNTPTNGVGAASFDIVRAINQCIATLQSSSATMSNQAVSLRFLLHFVGDIQQPLHCSTYVTAADTNGDDGGNGFGLTGTWSNLHSLWDAGGGYLTDSVGRPLTSARQTTLNNKVADVEAVYPFVGNPGTIPNPMSWAVEGWGLAESVCYVGVTNNTSPTSGYLNTAMITTRQRMAQGGKRLADLLNTIIPIPGHFVGNGNSSFGGQVGQARLILTNDGTNIFAKVIKGPNAFGDALVLYIDSVPGGFASTSGFGDTVDGLRRAISGIDASTNRSVLSFSGMAPDYAIALGPSDEAFGGLWQLANGGLNSLNFLADVNLVPTGTDSSATYNFSFNVGMIGLATNSGATIKLMGTYVSNTGYRSLEALPGNLTGAQGWNPLTQTAVATYTIASAPPTVSVQPLNTNLTYGSSVTITASAAGGNPLAFQWYNPLTNSIPGGTNISLTLTNPTVSASGNYIIIVTNAVGRATNQAAVIVNPAPLTVTANDRTLMSGDPLVFSGTEFITSGLVSPDTVTNVTLTANGSGSIVPTNALGGGLANYNITYVPGTLTTVDTNPALVTVQGTTGGIAFGFSNLPGASFTVFGTTNVTLPITAWSNLGHAVEAPSGSGLFQFTDPDGNTQEQRFYRVRSP